MDASESPSLAAALRVLATLRGAYEENEERIHRWESEDNNRSGEGDRDDSSEGSDEFLSQGSDDALPLEETWKDDCVLSSDRGSISTPTTSTDTHLPPEIEYAGTPSLVITGGCCQICEGLLKTALGPVGQTTKLHDWEHYSKLEERPSAKCNVCKIIRQTVMKQFPVLSKLESLNPLFEARSIYSDTEKELEGFALHLIPEVGEDTTPVPTMEIKVSKMRQKVPPEPRFGYQPGSKTYVKSRLQRIKALVNDWELDCQGFHMPCHLRNCGKGGHTELDCPDRKFGALLPTRLLDVGSRRGEWIRLYIPEPGERDRYLTLSYCWGKGGHKARTTDSTFEEYQKNIPWELLPKTIQDAITVARNTGFRYLWVDGLCIKQADKPGDYSPDWDKESSSVAQYYRNSAFTIAATSAEDCHQGLFLEEAELSWTIPRYPIHFEVSESEEKSFVGYLYWPLPDYKTSVIDSPLLKRGWVAQERISANRIVHFTKEGVFWECRDQYVSELGNHFDLDTSIKDQSFKSFEAPVWYQIGDDKEKSRSINKALDFEGKFFYKWCLAIKMFSALQFSFVVDRLPAISSVAEQFCINAIPGQGEEIVYAAGLLSDYMPRGLAWMSLVASETSIAPSWTWASVNHAVTFLELEEYDDKGHHKGPKWDFHIEPYQCYVCAERSGNRYGRVADGYLALKGSLASIQLPQYFDAETGVLKDEVDSSPDSQPESTTANPSQRTRKSRIAWDVIQSKETFEECPFCCLLLCSNEERQVALVLTVDWNSSLQLGTYSFQRVGMLVLYREDRVGGEEGFWDMDYYKVDIKIV